MLLPGALTQAIRNFAKSLESWLTNAMMNIPEEMVRIKVHSPCANLELVEKHALRDIQEIVFKACRIIHLKNNNKKNILLQGLTASLGIVSFEHGAISRARTDFT